MKVSLNSDTATKLSLVVRAVNGWNGTGALATGRSFDGTNTQLSIVPEDDGSIVYGGLHAYAGSSPRTPYVANASTAKISEAGGGPLDNYQHVAYHSGVPLAAGTPVTLGMTARGNEDYTIAAALEITGSPVDDAARSPNPAPVNGSPLPPSTVIQTDDFSPLPGALLVAIGIFTASSANVAISDDAGLTWGQNIDYVGTIGAVAFWTAKVPALPTGNYTSMITRSAGPDPLVSQPGQ